MSHHTLISLANMSFITHHKYTVKNQSFYKIPILKMLWPNIFRITLPPLLYYLKWHSWSRVGFVILQFPIIHPLCLLASFTFYRGYKDGCLYHMSKNNIVKYLENNILYLRKVNPTKIGTIRAVFHCSKSFFFSVPKCLMALIIVITIHTSSFLLI